MTDINVNAKPKYIFDRLVDITIEDLKKMGVKAVAIDLDNTSVYDFTLTPFKGVKKWTERVRKSGFKLCIISNSFNARAKFMGKVFCCEAFAPAKKPDIKCIVAAAKSAGVKISELALIGDRLFTDVLGANDCGAVSVYVKPYKKEFFIPNYWKKVRQEEADFLKTLNINRDLKSIYYK